jgi:hypothetical protein
LHYIISHQAKTPSKKKKNKSVVAVIVATVVATVPIVGLVDMVETGTDIVLEDVVVIAPVSAAASLLGPTSTITGTVMVAVAVAVAAAVKAVSVLRVVVVVALVPVPVVVSLPVLLDALLQCIGPETAGSSTDDGGDEQVALMVRVAGTSTAAPVTLGGSLTGLASNQAADNGAQDANPESRGRVAEGLVQCLSRPDQRSAWPFARGRAGTRPRSRPRARPGATSCDQRSTGRRRHGPRSVALLRNLQSTTGTGCIVVVVAGPLIATVPRAAAPVVVVVLAVAVVARHD